MLCWWYLVVMFVFMPTSMNVDVKAPLSSLIRFVSFVCIALLTGHVGVAYII